MRVLIYGLNFSPELTGIGKYTGEMAEWLAQQGHDVRAVTAPPYYPDWKVGKNYRGARYKRELIDGVNIWRCPLYVPNKPTTFSRLLHLISFSITSFPVVIRQIFWKPDVVFFVQPTLFSALGALVLAKFSGAKSIMHIQDYEVDAMFGLGMMQQSIICKIIRRCESWLMKRFDVVSTISFSMIDNAKRKGVDDSKLLLFPNWADTEFVKPQQVVSRKSANTSHKVTPDIVSPVTLVRPVHRPKSQEIELKDEWGFTESDKVVLYAGNIGKKQGLELVLDAAERMQVASSLKFVIVGAGAHVDMLKADAETRCLDNVFFKPLLPWARVPEMLALADVHLVVQKKGVADAVLPSKLTNILSAGGYALVTAEFETELGLLAEKYPGIYDCIEPENADVFTEALYLLLEKDLSWPNKVARDYAVEYLSIDNVLSRFESDLIRRKG
jgi:colanic acid biosynthesis glycosyl transferase WcaI